MSINLHIDRLVLDGFDLNANGKAQLSHALQQQLTHQLSGHPLHSDLSTSLELPKVSGGSIQLTQPLQPRAIGKQVGQAVYNGMDNRGSQT